MAAQIASKTSRTLVISLGALRPPAFKMYNSDPEVALAPRPQEHSVACPVSPADPASTPSARKNKSFQLHIGGVLNIPSADANARPQYSHPLRSPAGKLADPFEGLPFRALAERFGERVAPVLQAAREEQRRAARKGRDSAAAAMPGAPRVPHFLPFTRWAAQSEAFKSTFVLEDDPKQRKKARLSWYHPDDTMVPRDWFRGGLLADLQYYMPFGFGAPAAQTSATAAQPAAAR